MMLLAKVMMMKVMMLMTMMIFSRQTEPGRAVLTRRTQAEEHRVVGQGARRSLGRRRLKSTA